jgi:hypothetical protein
VDELSFRCGQMSVRKEAANVLPLLLASETVQCSWCPSWAVPRSGHNRARGVAERRRELMTASSAKRVQLGERGVERGVEPHLAEQIEAQSLGVVRS